MTPERSVNERVAEVVGWKCMENSCKGRPCTAKAHMPRYEHSADAALEAYSVMRVRGWNIWQTQDYGGRGERAHWRVELARPSEEAQGFGSTFASALCMAILAASEKERR